VEHTHLGRTTAVPSSPATVAADTPAGPMAPVPLPVRRSLVVRRMTEDQAVPLRGVRAGQFDRASAVVELIPASFAIGDIQHPVIEELDALRMRLQNAGAAGEADAVQRELDALEPRVVAYETFMADRAEVLADLERLMSTFKDAEDDDPELLRRASDNLDGKGIEPVRAKIARDLRLGRGTLKELSELRRAVESVVMPTNKDMQGLRATNAGDAEQVINKLVQGGLVRPDTLTDMWKASGQDDGVDQFGAKWSMATAGHHSGAAQWIREWEYHIHGSAIRARPYRSDDPHPNPVTDFRIKRGHIKPTAKARVLGVSVQIQNPAFIAEAKSVDSLAKFCRWGNGKGAQLLTSS